MKVVFYLVVSSFLVSVLSAQQQQPSPQRAQPPQQAQTKDSKPKQGGAPKPEKRRRVITNLAGFDLLEAKTLSKETIMVGATRAMPQPVALAPRLGRLYGASPTFAWSYEGASTRFVFALTDDTQAQVWHAEVSGTQYRYPAGAPALQPGRIYFWTVTVSIPVLGATASDPAGLTVVSAAQRQEIEQKLAQHPGDSYEAGVARAQVFTDARLWYDALAAWTELIEHYPDRSELYKQRGTIYAQLAPTKALAESDFARADQ